MWALVYILPVLFRKKTTASAMKTNMEINPKACEDRQCKHVKLPWPFFGKQLVKRYSLFLSTVRSSMKSGRFLKIPVNMIKKLS